MADGIKPRGVSSSMGGFYEMWSNAAASEKGVERCDRINRVGSGFVMLPKYVVTHPVLTLKEKAVISILLGELSVNEVEATKEEFLPTGLVITDLAVIANETRQTMSRLLKDLEKFGLVKLVNGEKGQKVIHLSVRGPWPMLGDHYAKGLSWRWGFVMRVEGKGVRELAKIWRKAVLGGLITDVKSQLLEFLKTGGRSLDIDDSAPKAPSRDVAREVNEDLLHGFKQGDGYPLNTEGPQA